MATTTAKIVSAAEWTAARKELLEKEKAFTKLRDELSRERRELPWEHAEGGQRFEGPNGTVTLAGMFEGRSQLIVYHFMLAPGWKEGCSGCSFIADHVDGMLPHLRARDITWAAVSRAPLAEIEAFKQRMGWGFPWYSSHGTDFNRKYQATREPEAKAGEKTLYNYQLQVFDSEERPGLSVFFKDAAGEVFHTYSTYARGLDILLGTYNYIDLTPVGRNEAGLKHGMAWVRHHDRY